MGRQDRLRSMESKMENRFLKLEDNHTYCDPSRRLTTVCLCVCVCIYANISGEMHLCGLFHIASLSRVLLPRDNERRADVAPVK